MPLTNALPDDRLGPDRSPRGSLALAADASTSAVSWGAILAGAAGAAALSLILLILGTGLGLSSVSPWARAGITATTFGVSTILWITVTQLLASGMGGYLAGRLRSKWQHVHTDEAYFRDTAHGFLAWAVASLATAALLGSTIGSIVSGAAQAGASVAGAAATVTAAGGAAAAANTAERGVSGDATTGYFVDALFRKDAGAAADGAATPAPAAEVARIFANSTNAAALPADDARYLGQLVAQRTGLAQADAEKRVTDTYARMRTAAADAKASATEAADKARKASAYAALWLFVSLLIGAFVASFAATFGGRQRDA